MSGNHKIIGSKDGEIRTIFIRKQRYKRRKGAPTLLSRAAMNVLQRRMGRYYAIRHSGKWRVYNVSRPSEVADFPNEDAAAMWLLHRNNMQ